ncbi:hypothetical protein [Bifidobacterium panos]|uniref:Uncharacterized protein n=1 Tax=Bifidobacterium panos TaxID=2675321 RepID=A0ABX1SY91_9BIFI|nr:hypothetical protein [Bifidobacterium sp. DSM 109963]NMN01843.1 hypothetical protein [Bifidobacterium sp. DSM 109963]
MNEDMRYIADDGTVLTDELVEELAAEAENGFANSILTPVDGRPWEKETSTGSSKGGNDDRLPNPLV